MNQQLSYNNNNYNTPTLPQSPTFLPPIPRGVNNDRTEKKKGNTNKSASYNKKKHNDKQLWRRNRPEIEKYGLSASRPFGSEISADDDDGDDDEYDFDDLINFDGLTNGHQMIEPEFNFDDSGSTKHRRNYSSSSSIHRTWSSESLDYDSIRERDEYTDDDEEEEDFDDDDDDDVSVTCTDCDCSTCEPFKQTSEEDEDDDGMETRSQKKRQDGNKNNKKDKNKKQRQQTNKKEERGQKEKDSRERESKQQKSRGRKVNNSNSQQTQTNTQEQNRNSKNSQNRNKTPFTPVKGVSRIRITWRTSDTAPTA